MRVWSGRLRLSLVKIMMPYEDTANMSVKDIMNIYGVSKGFAKTRQNY